ncbi:3'-5' exonuclease [Synechocystis salina]|uniref:DNA 3'-5' helicase n=1 Tax=Synechocystis salina LEGE 00031 TaxID=1828736 RepID=A0ABR9VT10_9SYNC|nr:3'-5' exonuclease [Synechocystis salina]MBE9242243.1 AAA family ATPase [Synechocystis salina LEGE 00041]MBE9254489.1 AAA family ATPase [Synechocystis salina LEGE 00031]
MFWITTLSPTFLNELLDLPRKVSKRVSNKIKILETDPYSAEGDAKKLQDRENIYRVRVGDYRIFYTIGENVVKVLTVRKRDDQTYRNPQDSTDPLPTAKITDPEILAVTLPDDIPTTPPPEPDSEPIPDGTSLPRQFSQELLQQWLIPQEYWTQLQQIQTEEALLNSALPEKYLNRILDNLFPRTIEEIEAQPGLVLPNSTDLDKFIEGDITDFLLKLDPDQEKLKDFGTGGPGAGKSTLALYRVEKLIQDGYQSILFTTYTNALVNYSQQLLTQLLAVDPARKGVAVNTVDWLAVEYYKSRYGEPKFAKSGRQKSLVEQAIKQAVSQNKLGQNPLTRGARRSILEKLGVDYLLEEIQTIILDQGVTNLEDYLAIARRGRGRPLQKMQREAVWIVYELWGDLLKRNRLVTFEQVRSLALAIAEKIPPDQKPYQAILIDEAQDLSPVALRFLLALVPNFEAIYLTADASQSLYQKGFSWTKIHQDLKVTGRTLLLKRNYRNTQEITLACEQILANSEAGDPDCVKQTPSKYHGDRPQLLPFRLPHPETEAIKNFLHRAAKKHRLPITSTAILCPTNQIGRAYAKQLSEEGLPAQFVSGQDIDLKAPYIKVLTLHSAKGLEFPFVAIALARSTFPEMLPYVLPEEEQNDYLNTQRRLLYVGCSRAMRSLLVTLPQGAAYFFENLCPPAWETISPLLT